jgi:hypothetical protein
MDRKDNIDDFKDIVTERRLKTHNGLEICCGYDIDKFGHGLTPEVLIIIKDVVDKYGIDMELILEDLNY